MYLTLITISFTVNIITYKIILFVRHRCMRRTVISQTSVIAIAELQSMIPQSIVPSTPYVTERGFTTLENATICMFIP